MFRRSSNRSSLSIVMQLQQHTKASEQHYTGRGVCGLLVLLAAVALEVAAGTSSFYKLSREAEVAVDGGNTLVA